MSEMKQVSQAHIKPTVAVFGLGRTGLPVALVAAGAGFKVLGIDSNKATVERLRAGECPFQEDGMPELLKRTLGRTFTCELLSSIAREEWARVEIILVHVGLSSFDELTNQSEGQNGLLEVLRELGVRGKTVILRSTVPVGSTRKLAVQLERLAGLKEGSEFFVAYVPERLWEGRAIIDAASLPHLVGALSEGGYVQSDRVFMSLGTGRVIHVSSPEVAEVAKLAENAWRDTTFAFANDLAMLCDKLRIDVFEVLKAANTDYPWNNIPAPGPVSGYCLKKDSVILAKSEEHGTGRLWVHGRKSNELFVETAAFRIAESGVKKVLVAGLSFKRDVDDFRDSHSLDLVQAFKSKGLEVAGCDSFLKASVYATLPQNVGIRVFKSIQEAGDWLTGAAIVLATPHSSFKADSEFKAMLANRPSVIVDMWGFWREKSEELKRLGIQYACVGSGKFWEEEDTHSSM